MYTSGILPYDIDLVTYNWKITMHLFEDVDPDILNDAVQEASTRYPYFKRRLVRTQTSYEIVENDLPIMVYDNTNEIRPMNSEGVNNHLIAVGYSGVSIDFAISHMLAGACGLTEFVRTVLYLYLTKKHGVELHVDGIKLPGQEIPEGERLFINREIVEGVDESDALDIESVSDTEHGEAPLLEYLLGLGIPKIAKDVLGIEAPEFTKSVYYRFEFPQKEFMAKARASDASPAALLSALMFKTLAKMWSKRFTNIQGMIAQNYRGEVGLPETTCDLVRYIHVRYANDLIDAPLSKICTVTRGQIMLQADKAFALRDAKHVVDRIETMESLPTFDEKKKYCSDNSIYGQHVLDSYQVSYVGRTEWGDMLPYIASGDIITEGHLMVEVLSVGDKFCATLQQEVADEKYKNALVETLVAEGIPFAVSDPIKKRIPEFDLPQLA